MWIYLIIVLTSIVAFLNFKYRHIYNKDLFKNYGSVSVPWIKNGFKVASMDQIELLAYFREISKRYQKSYRVTIFHINNYNIVRAKDVEKVLNSSKHLEKSDMYNLLHPFLKQGLLTSFGERWHARRRLLTPAFHFNILKEFCDVFKEEADRLIELLSTKVGNEIDIIPIATQFTLNTMCETALGVKLAELGNNGIVYKQSLYTIGKLLAYRLTKPWLRTDFVYTILGHMKKLKETLKPVHEFTESIIEKRREEFYSKQNSSRVVDKDENENIYMTKKKRYAMLDTLLHAQTQGLIDDEGICEETDTFTFEGHDTTSAGMTFTLLLLAHHPEVQGKLFEEIQDVLNGRTSDELTVDDFNRMNYMERVLKESLRIYPPVHFIGRKFSEDFTNDGHTYLKDSFANIMIYDIHRDPEIFPDPEKFDPDRFLPEECEKRNNFAFLAFSAGMRNCIGQRFAMLELKIMLTKVIENFKVLPVTTREEMVFIGDIILRTVDPIKMIFEARK